MWFTVIMAYALLLAGVSMLPLSVCAWVFAETYMLGYVGLWLGCLLLGGLGAWWWRPEQRRLSAFELYGAMLLFWGVLVVPLALAFKMGVEGISWVDALFAAMSGITTTGAEVFEDLGKLPKSILFFRHWLEFLGGLGVVMLVLFLKEQLGFEKAEALKMDLPGPVREHASGLNKQTTVAYVWRGYVGLWLVCGVGLYALGLSGFEALCESFSAVSTGGFGLYNDNLEHYHALVGVKWWVAGVVLVSAVGFVTHLRAWQRRSFGGYWQDAEFRWMLGFGLAAVLLIATVFSGNALVYYVLQLVFMSTTSGHTLGVESDSNALVLLVFGTACLIGGGTASTAGGIKYIRLREAFGLVARTLRLVLHPRLVVTESLKMHAGAHEHARASSLIAGYLILFVGVFWCSVLLLVGCGNDVSMAFSQTLATLTNTGAGLGALSDGYWQLNDASKIICMTNMLIGRLEIVPVVAVCYAKIFQVS